MGTYRRLIAVIFCVLAVAVLLPAGVPAAEEGWRFQVAPYVWIVGIDGEATVNGVKSDIDISFSDIMDNFDLGGQVNLQARKDRYGLFVDATYLSTSETSKVKAPNGVTVLKVDVDQDTWTVDFGAAYTVGRWPRANLDLIAGGRYWNTKTELDLRSPFFPGRVNPEKRFEWIDPILGARVLVNLTESLQLALRGDIGGFDVGGSSKSTWQLAGYLGYAFTPAIGAWAGYRYLAVDYEENDRNKLDQKQSGPVLGVSFRF